MDAKPAGRRAVLARRRQTLASGGLLGRAAGAPWSELRRLHRGAGPVASYAPLRDEPDPGDPGGAVLLPRLLADGSLEWALATGELVPGLRGTLAPSGPAVPLAQAALVLVPALSVDRRGTRLGRGGGSYDRALAQLGSGVSVVALLADDAELVDLLPAEPHDVAVGWAATPGGLVRLGAAPRPLR